MNVDDLTKLIADLDDFIRTPGASSWLRNTVLDLAVTGRLVPQEPAEGSGKDALEAFGSSPVDGRVSDAFSRQTMVETELPDTWTWALFSSVAEVAANLVKPDLYPDVMHVAPNNIEKNTGVLLPCNSVREDGVTSANHRFESGQILYSKIRPELSKVVVVNFSGLCSADMYPINPRINVRYLHLFMLSPLFLRQVNRSANRLAMPKVNKAALGRVLVAVPPEAEQKRIAGRVDELFELISRYESDQADADVARRVLTTAAFRHLGEQNDQFGLERLHELVRVPQDVEDLEIAVRELAVRGKLANRQAVGETAETLIRQVRHLVLDRPELLDRHGKLVAAPYALPDDWCWVPLGALLTEIEAGWSPAAQARPKTGDEWGVLKVSACSWGEFKPLENKALGPDQIPRPQLEVRVGDFLISRANTSDLVARSVVVDQTTSRLMLSDKTLRLSVVDDCNPRYLNLANLAVTARVHYETEATGTSSSMKNVSQRTIRRTPIPLPPRAEQDRIVAVVDELMTLTRKLRSELAA